MIDGPTPDEPTPPPAAPDLDVALVVPAAAYGTVATCDATAPESEPSIATAIAPPPEIAAVPAEAAAPAVAPPLSELPRVLDRVEGLARTIDEMGRGLGARIDGLQKVFDREIRAEATREKTVDRLHAELQEYKQDLLMKVLRPVFVDLIQLHDDIGKIADAQIDAEADVEVARLVGLMRGFQQGIEDILYRQGVEPFASDAETFDPRRQRAVATVPTDDPAQNKVVATRHRKGFQSGEKVIRPEIVSVYALRK